MDATVDVRKAVPVPEAAKLLGIGLTLAWEMTRDGRLPTLPLGARRRLVARATIERILSGDAPSSSGGKEVV
jgi:excisionase family DNA binding protein